MDEAKRLIKLANDRLKAGRTGVTLEIQGKQNWIYVRGTFPPKPGDKRTKPYQTRIALKMRAIDRKSVQLAELTAKKIGLDLNLDQFSWQSFSDVEPKDQEVKTTGQWIEEFEEYWWRGRSRSDGSKLNTWKAAYRGPLNRLPKDEPLTIDLVINWIIENSDSECRMRGHYVACARSLCEFAGLPTEPLKGLIGYKQNLKPINPRSLPGDEEILKVRESIKDPGWRFLFGLQACYGLRNHECFGVDFGEFPIIRVRDETKTGSRPVGPLYPEWAIEWNLGEPVYPERMVIEDGLSNAKLGIKITRYFVRTMPWGAYTLRHCYARRCAENDISVEVAAKLMGHTPLVHQTVYRAWVGEKVYLDAYKRAIENRKNHE